MTGPAPPSRRHVKGTQQIPERIISLTTHRTVIELLRASRAHREMAASFDGHGFVLHQAHCTARVLALMMAGAVASTLEAGVAGSEVQFVTAGTEPVTGAVSRLVVGNRLLGRRDGRFRLSASAARDSSRKIQLTACTIPITGLARRCRYRAIRLDGALGITLGSEQSAFPALVLGTKDVIAAVSTNPVRAMAISSTVHREFLCFGFSRNIINYFQFLNRKKLKIPHVYSSGMATL